MTLSLRTTLLLGLAAAAMACAQDAGLSRPRHIFLLIGDGMGELQAEAAERALGDQPGWQPSFRGFPVRGWQRTRSADREVTDSAAAITAILCGERTDNGRIAVSPAGEPLTSLAHLAHRQGWKIGVLSNIGIDHATPAGMYAVAAKRSDYRSIAAQLAASPFAFFGGSAMLGLQAPDGQGPDNEAMAASNGFVVATSRAALENLPAGKRVFAHARRDSRERAALPWAINYTPSDIRLAEFVSAAIRQLAGNPFFMLIEGGQIDSAGHANDLGSLVREVQHFNEAVQVCLAFAREHPADTLVVVTGDHETGGLTRLPEAAPEAARLLRRQRQSGKRIVEGFMPLLARGAPFAEARRLLGSDFGAESFTTAQLDQLEGAWGAALASPGAPDKRATDFVVLAGRLFVANAGYAFATGSHSAVDLPVYATGAGAETFAGTYDNTAIFHKLKQLMLADDHSTARAP